MTHVPLWAHRCRRAARFPVWAWFAWTARGERLLPLLLAAAPARSLKTKLRGIHPSQQELFVFRVEAFNGLPQSIEVHARDHASTVPFGIRAAGTVHQVPGEAIKLGANVTGQLLADLARGQQGA